MPWTTNLKSGGAIAGSVQYYADLPNPALYNGRMFYIREGSGGWLAIVGAYKWPKGLYISDGINWTATTVQVTLAEDAMSIVNIPNWAEFQTLGAIVNIDDVIIFNGYQYRNLTGTYNVNTPDLDTTNWGSVSVSSMQFKTNPAPISNTEGVAIWNPIDKCLDVYDGVTKQQLNQEQNQPVKNNTLVPFTNGQVVYITGSDGYFPTIDLASCDGLLPDSTVLGMLTQDIAPGAVGKCTFSGKVRGLDTTSYVEQQALWLGHVPGSILSVQPEHPCMPVKIGTCVFSNVLGDIFVHIEQKPELLAVQVSKDPTGFYEPENILVEYAPVARTISLSGAVEAYYRGKYLPQLSSGWVSTPHPAVNGIYFLYFDGTDFVWSTTPWTFDNLMIAFVNYGAVYKWAIREVHGMMDWESHREFHNIIGTYKESGGTLSNYALNSTTVGNRRPYVSATTVLDEDLKTILALNNTTSYTTGYLSGAGASSVFNISQSEIVPVSGNTPYWNQFTGGAWQQTPMIANSYMSLWQVAIPVTGDVDSQRFRYIWIQGQTNGTLSATEAETPNNINLSMLNTLASEFVFINKVVIRYVASNWFFTSVTALTGNKFIQTGSPSGAFLTTVTTDASLTGEGTVALPLSLTVPISSGTYNPGWINIASTNIQSFLPSPFQYMRVGNVVTVSGRGVVDTTATGPSTLVITLPIGPNGSYLPQHASGSMIGSTAAVGYIWAGNGGNYTGTPFISFGNSNVPISTGYTYSFHFTYYILA